MISAVVNKIHADDTKAEAGYQSHVEQTLRMQAGQYQQG